jgi:hypothetical protein
MANIKEKKLRAIRQRFYVYKWSFKNCLRGGSFGKYT